MSAASIERPRAGWQLDAARLLRLHPLPTLGAVVLVAILLVSLAAPMLAPRDPIEMDVIARLQPPSAEHWFGTDQYGRDILSRALYGGRISALIAISVALLSTATGFLVGAFAGFFRLADLILMRVMDGLMAIPAILLAIALMSLAHASVAVVVVAIAIPEVPRAARLVRSVVLTIREQTYVEAAIVLGVGTPRLILAYVLPNSMAPLIVQATYICASAVLLESYLSFLGVGTPPETPSWGNIIAEGRLFVQIAPWQIVFPGMLITAMVLSINVLGDGLRDVLDPRLRRRL